MIDDQEDQSARDVKRGRDSVQIQFTWNSKQTYFQTGRNHSKKQGLSNAKHIVVRIMIVSIAR